MGNFSGTTVKSIESYVRVAGEVTGLVDQPGAYTLESGNPAEMEASRFLSSHDLPGYFILFYPFWYLMSSIK